MPKVKAQSITQQTRDPDARKKNVLYLPCRRIESKEIASPAFQDFLRSMREAMNFHEGIGIAANQVGESRQVFMIEAQPDNPRYAILGEVPFQIFINPRITKASPESFNFWHGCLSAAGEKRGNVAAYEWIEYDCLDEKADRRSGRLEGLAAVIFQHEFRHLLGGTYLDRAAAFLSKEALDAAIDNRAQSFYEKAPANLPHLIGDYRIGDTLEQHYARSH